MARSIAVALVLLLTGLLGVAPVGDGPDAVAQSGGEPTPPPLEPALLPGATSFETLASDVTTTVPDGPVLLRLERVALGAGAATSPRTASGPELLLVEAGEVVVADAFGIEAPLAAAAHVLLRPGVAYRLRNESGAKASLLRLVIAATVDPSGAAPQNAAPDGPRPNAGTPSAASEAAVLAQAALPNAPSGPALVFLSRVTWDAGAESGALAPSGPIGLVVESGTLTVDSPSGIKGRLPAGAGVLFPGEMTIGARNAGDEPVVALLFGVVRNDQRRGRAPAAAPAEPAAAPRAEPPSADGAVEIAAVDIGWEYEGQRTTALEPLTVPVTAGQVISLPNRGAVRHTFAVEAFGDVVVDMPFGETVEYTIPTDIEPGEYEFICTMAGHAAAGMVGVLLVQEADAVAAPTGSGADAPVEIVGVDIAWEYNGVRSTTAEPARVEVAPGQTISLPNAGASPHNFAVEAFGNVVVDMPVGETVAYTVPADVAPGEYDFVCTIAGHAAAGMVGMLVVRPPR